MMLEKQTPWPKAASGAFSAQGDNSIALKTQQILQIAGILGPTVDDELAVVRSAWIGYQSTRERGSLRISVRSIGSSQSLEKRAPRQDQIQSGADGKQIN